MGAFKLGKMTFGSLFKKPETILYPIETKPQPMGLKGHIEIDVDNCILCGMCDRSCATNCIKVDKQAATWSIDRLQCVQCGYCITVCPKKCLAMNPNYAPATTEHTVDSFSVPVKEKPAKTEKKAVSASADKQQVETASASSQATAPIKAVNSESGIQYSDAPTPIIDEQVAALIGLMDPAKAEKVKAALG